MSILSNIVPKPWGYEYCAFDNGKAAVWILHIARGRTTSRHCHPNKKTTLIVLQGEVMFNGEKRTPLSKIDIPKGEYHQTGVDGSGLWPSSENGSWLMEIEEPSDKGDIIRENDEYGRSGKPIESDFIVHGGQMLKLSHKVGTFLGYDFKLESTMGGAEADLLLNVGGEVLGIYRKNTMRVADYVANFVADLGVRHVFGIVGGGAMHLDDSFGHHERLKFINTHHEQSAAMAAEAYSRLTGMGCCLVTTGPGGTNALTGVACAWIDSIPMLIISGQVGTPYLIGDTGMRQRGIQESDIARLAQSVTKSVVTVTDATRIRYEMERAAWLAKSGRPGPVWVDIPLDIQGMTLDIESLEGFATPEEALHAPGWTGDIIGLLASAQRPVIVVGNGVHLAGAEVQMREFAASFGIPIVTSWTAGDIMGQEPTHIGHCGIFGDRASNFAVQNSDVLLTIGCRLSMSQTGYNLPTFARAAQIVMVDMDDTEHLKFEGRARLIQMDAKQFLENMKGAIFGDHSGWLAQCHQWMAKYPVYQPEYAKQKRHINSFHFIEKLSESLPDDAVVVTDMGTAFTCTFQTAKMRVGQRWIAASGHAPMGYGLPAAIGAAFATGKPVVAIVGDGGLQMNVQELATIKYHNLPITIFVLNNAGYLTMKHTFANHFGRLTGADATSGLGFPSPVRVAAAYGIDGFKIKKMEAELDLFMDSPFLFEIRMKPDQQLIPRSTSLKRPDGTIVSKPIEDLFPFLPREEFKKNMLVPMHNVLE